MKLTFWQLAFIHNFRLSWISWYFNEPLEIEARLKQKMIDILEKEGNVAEYFNSDTDNDHDETTSDTFFGCLFSKQKQRNSSVADRVNKFLSANPTKIVDLKAFSDEGLKKYFLRYNTGLLSSAAVERLFSIRKDILKPKHCGLTDEHFEMLTFLKGN